MLPLGTEKAAAGAEDRTVKVAWCATGAKGLRRHLPPEPRRLRPGVARHRREAEYREASLAYLAFVDAMQEVDDLDLLCGGEAVARAVSKALFRRAMAAREAWLSACTEIEQKRRRR